MAVEGFVNTLGFPGLKDDVAGWIEGVATLESVTDALQTRGLIVEDEATAPVVPPTDEQETPTPTTSKLGQQVAEAALGDGVKSADERLMEATTVSELNVIMEELGGARDYS